MKQQLYALALVAVHADHGGISYTPATCMAVSVEEAVGKGITAAKLTWPKHHNHTALASVVPDNHIIEGFNALLQGVSSETPNK